MGLNESVLKTGGMIKPIIPKGYYMSMKGTATATLEQLPAGSSVPIATIEGSSLKYFSGVFANGESDNYTLTISALASTSTETPASCYILGIKDGVIKYKYSKTGIWGGSVTVQLKNYDYVFVTAINTVSSTYTVTVKTSKVS